MANERGEDFDATDEQMLKALATVAAHAIGNSIRSDRERPGPAPGNGPPNPETPAPRPDVLAQVIGAQEAERARVARDLHDQIGQSLTSILLATQVLEQTAVAEDDFRHRLDDLRGLVADTLQDVRRIAFDLRPTILDDIGLMAALDRLLEKIEVRHGLTVKVRSQDLDDQHRLSREAETAIYRIVQEALTNVSRHAGVRSAELDIDSTGEGITVAVRDNGIGFDPASTSTPLGLAGMHERAALVGGDLVVVSTPGAGTTVQLEIPRG